MHPSYHIMTQLSNYITYYFYEVFRILRQLHWTSLYVLSLAFQSLRCDSLRNFLLMIRWLNCKKITPKLEIKSGLILWCFYVNIDLFHSLPWFSFIYLHKSHHIYSQKSHFFFFDLSDCLQRCQKIKDCQKALPWLVVFFILRDSHRSKKGLSF